ncbi:MAG: 23S rRNA (guanosine(2251)-2'-O)-methyltransferase RlmB [Pseudomonadota bacterium]
MASPAPAGSRVVYGVNPVRELVLARAAQINVVYFTAGASGPGLSALREICRNRGVSTADRDVTAIESLAGKGARHQGVVALAGEYAYANLDDLLIVPAASSAGEAAKQPLLLVLDGIQDPQNLGAIVRCADALGANGVVIPKDRAAQVTAAVVKASAGATEHVRIAQVTNLARTIDKLRERGLWAIGAVAQGGQPPTEVDLTAAIILVLGSEGRGLRHLIQRSCDLTVQIPMVGMVSSLNVAVTAGILLYEARRQRK